MMKKMLALLLCGILMMTAWACAEEGAQQEAADGISDALLGSMIAGAQESAQEAEVEEAKADYRHIDRMFYHPEEYNGERLNGLYYVVQGTSYIGQPPHDFYITMQSGKVNAGQYCTLLAPGKNGDVLVGCLTEEDWGLEYGEYVYVSGMFQDAAVTMDMDGNSVEMVFILGDKLERQQEWMESGTETTWDYSVNMPGMKQGELSIEVMFVDFQTDGSMMLMTKTQDNSVTEYQDYYVDVIVHQGDKVTWNTNLNFWIHPGIYGVDYIPFPALDSTQPMTVEFWVYDDEGERLYDPLVIELQPTE